LTPGTLAPKKEREKKKAVDVTKTANQKGKGGALQR
jgi:hypothetical protein